MEIAVSLNEASEAGEKEEDREGGPGKSGLVSSG